MTELNSSREDFLRKRKEALDKLSSCREGFRRKEKRIKADLAEAGKTWEKVSQKFKWWQSLP
ncbi:MAG: hypothetical protein Q7J67_01480 [bacterium]|nr:hypothetical protein [bacterium]